MVGVIIRTWGQSYNAIKTLLYIPEEPEPYTLILALTMTMTIGPYLPNYPDVMGVDRE